MEDWRNADPLTAEEEAAAQRAYEAMRAEEAAWSADGNGAVLNLDWED